MPNEKGHLYLFEAIELRNEYDRHIKLLEQVLGEGTGRSDSFLRSRDEEIKEPANDFRPKELEEQLKKTQTKRVKLNLAIQEANFTHHIKYDRDEITIAEALEIRKNLLTELNSITDKVKNAAYKKIIHKEGRDIIREPKNPFVEVYDEFRNKQLRLRELVNLMHIANHQNKVKFKEE